MKVGFFGSGAFGLPTLAGLGDAHQIAFVVSQPDRPAGRKRQLRSTPISTASLEHDYRLLRPERLDDKTIETIRSIEVDAWVVIAYGLKLPSQLLDGQFACNLHASLLPRWRGAAPIQRCLMAGDPITGVSVITLADVMDAGEVLATVETAVDPFETAGELHDRLAELGRQPVLDTLSAVQAGSLHPSPQDQSAITLAPKLSREEGTVDFSLAAELVRGRVHGLTPWPGCDIRIGDQDLRLRRVKSCPDAANDSEPGTLLESNLVACGSGQLEILEVQPAGGRPMSWKQWQLGHRIQPGTRICAT